LLLAEPLSVWLLALADPAGGVYLDVDGWLAGADCSLTETLLCPAAACALAAAAAA
jgi:hypothetical protein